MVGRPFTLASWYAVLFAGTAGMYFILAVTGFHGRFFFSVSITDQSLFLTHLLTGYAFVPVFALYLQLHLRLLWRTPGVFREHVSTISGAALVAMTAIALVSGIDLSIHGAQTSRSAWVGVHSVSSYATLLLFPLHVVWALFRRKSAGRASSLPIEGRLAAPTAILVSGLAMSAAMAFHVPAASPAYPVPPGYTYVKNSVHPFFPGQARTSNGKLIPIDHLSQSDRCGRCHEQIYREWNSSTHRFSASNDHYLAQVRLRIHDVPIKPHLGARFCANCHEPIALFAGEIDPKGRGIDFEENRQQGISCLSCHRTEGLHSGTMGNANVVVSPHISYLFEKNTEGLTAAVGRMLIRSKPGQHRADLMPPLLKRPEFCSSCHKFSIDETVNPHGFFRLQNTFDEWKASKFSDASSGLYKRCQDCHMPLVASTDPSAKEYVEDGHRVMQHRSHRFLGSNTARPFLDGDSEQLKLTERFLKRGDVTVTIDAQPMVKAGTTEVIEVTVANRGVGHRFPTGTIDTHDCWLELTVTDAGGRVVLRSGWLEPDGSVEPRAHTFTARAIDRQGNWLYRRDMWNLAGFANVRTVYPGSFDTKPFLVVVPQDTRGPLRVVAKLKFRKYNPHFTRFVFGRGPLRDESGYDGRHSAKVQLPITVIDEDSALVEVVP